MTSTQTAVPRDPRVNEVSTFAAPQQRRRYIAAMRRLASAREPGQLARVYISAKPQLRATAAWDRWTGEIREALPEVELLDYATAFAQRSYDEWPAFAQTLDGLVIIGWHIRAGSRVHRIGPVARQELRSLVATKPVLLYSPGPVPQGLIPVIDCDSRRLDTDGKVKLKLTAPKRWRGDDETLQAALAALGPGEGRPSHLADPFKPTTVPTQSAHQQTSPSSRL